MNKTLKLTTALGTSMFALAFAVTAASADTSIVNTGSDADINDSATQNTTVNVSNSNTSTVTQSSFSLANTGGNFTNGNVGGGSISSGDALSSTSMEANANQNQTGIALPTSSLGGSDVEVVNTGADLDLNTSNTQNTVVGATNTNIFNGQQTAIG